MPGSAWQVGRARDFRGGESQSELPELVGRNQLIRMENAMLYPSGWLTAAHRIDSLAIINSGLGIAIVPYTNGTYNVYSAPGNDIVYGAQFFETGASSPVNMTAAAQSAVDGARIVGASKAVEFLGKHYCVNPNSDDTKNGILNLTDLTLINIDCSGATSVKLRLHMNRLWLLDSNGLLHISDNGDATTWNALNVLLLPNSEKVIDFHPVQGGAVVYCSSSVYAMYGSTYEDISFLPLMPNSEINPKHFTKGSVEVSGVVYILSTEGIYAASLNGVQFIPHHQEVFFKDHFGIFSDPAKEIEAIFLNRFQAIIFTWRNSYNVNGQSLVFYLSGAYSKLNRLLPTAFPYAVSLNDANTDFLWAVASGNFAKSEYPTTSMLEPQICYLQTRHEDCDSYREKVWSEFTITTDEVVYGVTVSAYLDDAAVPIVVADEISLKRGENRIWLDILPRSFTLSLLIKINNTAILSLASDDDENDLLVDENGDELVSVINPGNWTIKELRLRYREAGPAL